MTNPYADKITDRPPSWHAAIRIVPIVSALFVFLVSGTLLIIWLTLPSLKDFSSASMKANTTVTLVVASISLFLLRRDPAESRRHSRVIGMALAIFVVFSGLSNVAEYLTGVDFGIDQLLVTDAPIPEALLYPGRMSPIAGVSFVLTGLSLLFLDFRQQPKKPHLASVLLMPVFVLCLLAIVGYFYDVPSFYKLGPYIRIAWQSAICFQVLVIGILFSRPNVGPISVPLSNTPGGYLARRLFIATVVIPLVLGRIELAAERAGILGPDLGAAMLMVALVLIFSFLTVTNAKALNAIDEQRTRLLKELEQAISLRDEFLSIASHELKTPLTSLSLQVQATRRAIRSGDTSAFSPERVTKALGQNERQVARLARLVDDMLDISRLRSGKFRIEREKFDLGEMVRDVTERLQFQLTSAGAETELKIEGKTEGSWDRVRMEQVITNLLTNAMKYGKSKPVQVRVHSNSANIMVSVEDQGIGIAKEDQERIFNRYERASAENEGGLGLGLYITRQIIEAHGGKIWVESEPGLGSTFTFQLPIS